MMAGWILFSLHSFTIHSFQSSQLVRRRRSLKKDKKTLLINQLFKMAILF